VRLGTAEDRKRFRLIATAGIVMLALMEIVIALSAIWLGFTWIVVALLVGMPILAIYLAYLIRLFAKPC
jgi:hypothetical protein